MGSRGLGAFTQGLSGSIQQNRQYNLARDQSNIRKMQLEFQKDQAAQQQQQQKIQNQTEAIKVGWDNAVKIAPDDPDKQVEYMMGWLKQNEVTRGTKMADFLLRNLPQMDEEAVKKYKDASKKFYDAFTTGTDADKQNAAYTLHFLEGEIGYKNTQKLKAQNKKAEEWYNERNKKSDNALKPYTLNGKIIHVPNNVQPPEGAVPYSSSQGITMETPDGSKITIGGGGDKTSEREFMENEIAVKQYDVGIDRLKEGINKEENVVGPLGRSIAFLDSAVSQVSQTIKVLADNGVEMSSEDFLNEVTNDLKDSRWDNLKDIASKSAVHRSNLVSLAYLLARRNERGGRITEADFNRAMETIGGMTGSVKQFNAILDNLQESSRQNFAIEYGVRQGKRLPENFWNVGGGENVLPEGLPPGSKKTGTTKDGKDIYTTPDGIKLVEE